MEQVLRHIGDGETEFVKLPGGAAKIVAIAHLNSETFRLALEGGSYVDVKKAGFARDVRVGDLYSQVPEPAAKELPSAEDLDAAVGEAAVAEATSTQAGTESGAQAAASAQCEAPAQSPAEAQADLAAAK